jgi:hypothetical protein
MLDRGGHEADDDNGCEVAWIGVGIDRGHDADVERVSASTTMP